MPKVECSDVESTLSSFSITEEHVKKELKKLKINKSPGYDNIHPRLLRELAEELSEPHLFSLSLTTAVVPFHGLRESF